MTTSARRAPRARIALALFAAFVTAAALVPSGTVSSVEAAEPAQDGLSSRTAAGSCWEIKQNRPSATDGVYWLVTPALVAPDQFYCDMTTDGGGWVLIGRGREGWKTNYNGLRTPELLRSTVTGPAAFAVAQLPAKTVDGLLNNGPVSAVPDGVRVRRASNAQGTAFQEVRFTMPKRTRWAWALRGEHPVGAWRFDGSTGSGGTTANFGNNSQFRRVDHAIYESQGWTGGFAYGPQVTGTNSADSYLYSATNGAGNARPFAQLFLRPRLRLAGMTFASIPDAGAPAQTMRAQPDSDALRTVWGVSGLANGTDGELHTEVAAFGQVGNTVFVGGNFRYVQRGANSTGANKIEQPYLAAFDADTGEFIPSFRPVLNNQVKAIHGLPDGRLAVGGQFSQANGAAHAGLVILNPVTGQTAAGWQVAPENRSAGGITQVRGLSMQGDWLYLSGTFTHMLGSGRTASAWNGGRINVASGVPDINWDPHMNGTSIGVEAAVDGSRAYYSGYFSTSGSDNVQTLSASAFQTAPNAPLVQPVWVPHFSKPPTNIYQFGVAESAGHVYVGGSQHSLFGYDRDDFALRSGSITKSGGDFQSVEANSDTVFAGCHCGDFTYENAYTWSGIGTNWTQGDGIFNLGAWDAASGRYLPDFNPITQNRRGFGVWALFQASNGVLWAGGDLRYVVRAGEFNQWAGGFTRFAPRDAQAPSTPTSASALAVDASTALLSWGASSDNAAVSHYEILRENRVVETTTSREVSVPVEAAPVRYFIRGVDAAGNRSATTPVIVVAPPAADALTFITTGADWRWRFASTTLPAEWRSVDYDDSGWQEGASFLGYNSALIETDILPGAPSPRPPSAQFRHEFTVDDPANVTDAMISVVADDGVVVYLNGTEIGRANLPTGNLTQNTFATAAPRTSAAAANRIEFSVPSALLVDGTNVIAASTHLNYRSTPDASFDLRFTAKRGQSQPPAAPTVTATAIDPPAINVAWTHPLPAAVSEYRVLRNGAQVATVDGAQSSYSDSGLLPGTAYSYSVVAVDAFGRQSPGGTAAAATPSVPVDPDVELVARATAWSWLFDSAPWDPSWNQPAFDDAAWKDGSAPLGLGSTPLGTDISIGAPSPRPLSAQFRHAFQVADPADFESMNLSVLANDGVVVYLNGVEIARANLPAGALGQNSFATAAPRTSAATANPVVVAVPVGLLVPGENVIAASTHANYRSTPDLGFDLSLTAVR